VSTTGQETSPTDDGARADLFARVPGVAAVLGGASPRATNGATKPSVLGVQNVSVDTVKSAVGTGRALAETLGIELPALNDIKLSDLARGSIELRIALVDDHTYKIPFGDGPPLELHVPRAPFGLALIVEIDIETVTNPDGLVEPVLGDLRVSFEANGTLPNGERAPHDLVAFPLILNPSVLQPNTGFFGGVKNLATDAAADIRLGGFTVDKSGEIHIAGDVVVVGFNHQDFHELAKPSLPRLETRLSKIADGQIIAEAAQSGSPVGGAGAKPSAATELASLKGPSLRVRDFLDAFSKVAWNGTWSAELETHARPKAPSTALYTHGALTINRELEVHGDARIEAVVEEKSVKLVVEGEADLRRARGALRGQVGHDGGMVGHGVSFTREGLTIDGVDVEALLPMDVRLPSTTTRAPRVGTPAFAESISALLGETYPPHEGNEIAFLRDGDDVFQKRLELIDKAGPGSTVLMQTFIFKDDVTGRKLVDALTAAKARGADVRVMLDTVGCIGANVDEIVTGPAVFQKLRAGGVDVVLINDPRASLTAFVTDAARLLEQAPDVLQKLEDAGATGLASFVRALADVESLEQLLQTPSKALILAALGAKARTDLPRVLALDVSDDTKRLLRGLVEDRAPELLRDLSRDHRKQLIVYGPTANGPIAEVIAGGNNVGDDYLMEPHSDGYDPTQVHKGMPLWNDLDLHVKGTGIVENTLSAFARTYQEMTGKPLDTSSVPDVPKLAQGETLRVVHHQPIAPSRTGTGDNHLTNVMLATLAGLQAGDRMVIENPYFLPIPALRDAMIDAARRGAKLTIVTNGLYENNDTPIVAQLSRRFVLRDLVAQDGIEVFEAKATAQPIHRKTMVVETRDGKTLSVVGSENLDGLSMRVNNEMFFLGGTALDPRPTARDSVAKELLADARRDTSRDVAHRVTSRDFENDTDASIVGDYITSLLMPLV